MSLVRHRKQRQVPQFGDSQSGRGHGTYAPTLLGQAQCTPFTPKRSKRSGAGRAGNTEARVVVAVVRRVAVAVTVAPFDQLLTESTHTRPDAPPGRRTARNHPFHLAKEGSRSLKCPGNAEARDVEAAVRRAPATDGRAQAPGVAVP